MCFSILNPLPSFSCPLPYSTLSLSQVSLGIPTLVFFTSFESAGTAPFEMLYSLSQQILLEQLLDSMSHFFGWGSWHSTHPSRRLEGMNEVTIGCCGLRNIRCPRVTQNIPCHSNCHRNSVPSSPALFCTKLGPFPPYLCQLPEPNIFGEWPIWAKHVPLPHSLYTVIFRGGQMLPALKQQIAVDATHAEYVFHLKDLCKVRASK
jgi:hypothetical protein